MISINHLRLITDLHRSMKVMGFILLSAVFAAIAMCMLSLVNGNTGVAVIVVSAIIGSIAAAGIIRF
jgi:hypothetical protein